MNNIFFYILILFLISSCKNKDNHTQIFLIKNKEIQPYFLLELQKNNIDFTEKENGIVYFSPKDITSVHEIAFATMKKLPSSSREELSYPNKNFTTLLINNLDKASIPYTVSTYRGDLSVILEKNNEYLWRPIVNKIDKEHADTIAESMRLNQ